MDQKAPALKLNHGLQSLLVLLVLSSLLLLCARALLQTLSVQYLARISFSSPSSACDYTNGDWVWDEDNAVGSYTEDCPFLDRGFQCIRNGRPNAAFRKWRWQPRGCDLPRFNASELLERSRNKRIVFVGDSIGRNHWESMVCMLSTGVKNKSSMYEADGKAINKHEGFLSIRFDEFNLTVEYFRTPFLVVIGHPPPNSPPEIKKSVRVDTADWLSKAWAGADVLIFNTGHWWTPQKTVKLKSYFQVGNELNKTMDVRTAFQMAMETMRDWASYNVQLDKSFLFFRSFSPSHYRDGNWQSGGNCNWTVPGIDNSTITSDAWYNPIISEAVRGIKGSGANVYYLNISYLTEMRRDGHISKHLEPARLKIGRPQDCSHWCLPGVPDTWNQIIYAHLLGGRYGLRTSD